MDNYPVKEVTVIKTFTTTVFIRANSNDEALIKAYDLAIAGKLESYFEEKPEYEVEKYNEYKEGWINEEVIIKDDVNITK